MPSLVTVKEDDQGARKTTRDTTRNKDLSNDPNNGNKVTVEDKNERKSPSPVWNFLCVREIENAKRERVERRGPFPAFMADMTALAATYGKMSDQGRAYLATLSDDTSDDGPNN